VPGFTVGGPVRRDRTFFFAGFQQDTRRSTQNFPLTLPTAAAAERLRSLFASNPRLDLYLGPLGNLRGTAAPFSLALGADPQTGVNRGSVEFARAARGLPATEEGPQWLVRIDHQLSAVHRLSWRYIRDSRIDTPSSSNFPGFVSESAERNQNFLFTSSYTFGPSFTNEFRFSYGRLDVDQVRISPGSVPEARTLPVFTITNVSAPGSGSEQFRHAHNLLFQETQTKLSGRHIFRYGAELLRQTATQLPNAIIRGQIPYTNAPLAGYSAFANFLDDYSGPSARMQRHIGATVFHPNQFRQTYFLQDTWKATPALTLTLGLRYENFGQFANALRYPAFAGFSPESFLEPNKVNRDNNNFGPAFGFAWSPSIRPGWLGRLLGDRLTVWRGGYQISYQALYTQMLSLNLATTTPNALFVENIGAATGRGDSNWSARLPAATPRPPTIADAQEGVIEKDLRSPYTERWSFGFQRQLPGYALLDVSYVGAAAHKLTTNTDFNPGPDGMRLYPAFGIRRVRTSQGNSAYHSLQTRLDRRFARGFQLAASYTWSKSLDSTSEGIGQTNTQFNSPNLTSVPVAQGGLKLDRGVSDFHRGQRLTLLYLWQVPGPSKRVWKHALGGWSIAGVTTFQTGTPFTMKNDSDRNRDGMSQMDRPDISNPLAPLNTRAMLAPATGPQRCSTGYRNPDTSTCVSPSEVYWIEGMGPPNGSTVGRNTMFTGG
ncbi:MAG: TonB-dependent receptor domain-containing protein, partial [Bryobacteraceae bacterium]